MANKLFEKYSKEIFDFCIKNSNDFACVPIDGTVVFLNKKYYLKTNTLRENKNEYDLFELNDNPTEEEIIQLKKMQKYPQHLYINLLQYQENYEIITLYSKKSDKDANREIDYMTYEYYLNYKNILKEDDFIKQIKKSLRIYNQTNNKQMSLSQILKL